MEIREELLAMAVRLHNILQYEDDELSKDDKLALLVSKQLLEWAAMEPQEIVTVKGKPSITFAELTLGEQAK